MLNKKGLTLVEIIVSVALIAFVMLLLVRLLVNVTNDDNLIASNTSLLVTKSNIINRAETDFLNKGIVSVECLTNSINFGFSDLSFKTLEKSNTKIWYDKKGRKLADGATFSNGYELVLTADNKMFNVIIPVTYKGIISDIYTLKFVYAGYSSIININDSCQTLTNNETTEEE